LFWFKSPLELPPKELHPVLKEKWRKVTGFLEIPQESRRRRFHGRSRAAGVDLSI
jgi:hypothetical protein